MNMNHHMITRAVLSLIRAAILVGGLCDQNSTRTTDFLWPWRINMQRAGDNVLCTWKSFLCFQPMQDWAYRLEGGSAFYSADIPGRWRQIQTDEYAMCSLWQDLWMATHGRICERLQGMHSGCLIEELLWNRSQLSWLWKARSLLCPAI